MQRLKDQVAIVTGGAQGIGGATARRFAEEGARVLIADVDEAAAVANRDRIREAGGTAELLVTDVSKHDQVRAMVERAVELWGGLHLLVNNAYGGGRGQQGSAVEVSEEGWDHGMALLVKSMFLAVKYAAPHIQRAGGGAIVNIASVHGLLMAPGKLVYEAGKSAVIGLTKQMACDFGPVGIRVNCICPGHIVTERMARRWGDNAEGLQFFDQQYPLRRTGKPVDIANAVVFLCSDEASFITGHALVVDGGLTIQLQEDLGVHLAKYAQARPDLRFPY
ncbi:MAG TPA: SDR family oxidoreductase [Chloroflexota bacterium]|nr:SDR family oxidoreductase [Chloroflexota bacterium]